MKIGLLGGSFDPIHNGHLHMAKSAYEEYQLDEVWLIPSGHAPHKEEDKMTSANHRYKMCELAVKKDSFLKVSRIEIDAPETSYTYRTLQKLTDLYPMHEFYFIMGGDSIDYFDKWVHPEIISSLCTILVLGRNEIHEKKIEKKIRELSLLFPCKIQLIHNRLYPTSSTEIRTMLSNGEINHQKEIADIPQEVLEYINSNRLYQCNTEAL